MEVLTMARRRVVLRVEELDGRVVPSVNPVAVPLVNPGGPIVVPQHALAGTAKGTYTTGAVVPDVGQTYQLDGTGTFAALGKVKIHGSVHTPGFILNGHTGGTLKFSGVKGSVVVQLQALTQTGSSSSLWFHYQVVHGDGIFKHVTDQGTLRLDLTAPVSAHARHFGDVHGTFTLRI
jgi:hypothetical protein